MTAVTIAEMPDSLTSRTSAVPKPVQKRKRARSYRSRINSFNLPLRPKASQHHSSVRADPPSSPLSGSRSASDTDASSSPACPAPLYPPIPSASNTYLTHARILQLSDQLSRQSSHQLLTLTRTNTKKNAGPRPFAMAINRVWRRMRFPPSGPSASISMSSIHSLATSMSSSSSSGSNSTNPSSSAQSMLPLRRGKPIPKVVSFSQEITILTAHNVAGKSSDGKKLAKDDMKKEDEATEEGEIEEKWVDIVETKELPSENAPKAPRQDRGRRISLSARRRTSFAERPLRIRSDTTSSATIVKKDTMAGMQPLRNEADSGLLTHLRRRKVAREVISESVCEGWDDSADCSDSSNSLDCPESPNFPGSPENDMQVSDDSDESLSSCSSESDSCVSDCSDSQGNDSGCNEDDDSSGTESISPVENSSGTESISPVDGDREDDEDEEAEAAEKEERKQRIVNTKSARNLEYLYATTQLHSRPNYSELRGRK